MRKYAWFILLSCASSVGVSASFQNLDFDSANTNNVINVGATFGPTSELLPGWQLFLDGIPEPTIGYNNYPLGLPYATIADANNPEGLPVVGVYSLVLAPGFDLITGIPRHFTLIQVGDVPADALSIHFISFGAPFELQVNGSLVPLFYDFGAPMSNPNHRRGDAAGDVSAFAGQNVELKFTTLRTSSTPGPYENILDGISFSAQAVPEPSTLGLLTVGALLLFAARRARHG